MKKDLKWTLHNPYKNERGTASFWTDEHLTSHLALPNVCVQGVFFFLSLLKKCYYWDLWWERQPVPLRTIFIFG